MVASYAVNMEMGSPRDFMAASSGTRSGLVADTFVSDMESLTLSS